jgi:cell division initiation protein
MSLSAEDVERQTFKERFKGYDMDEVDAFLDRVVARLRELQSEADDLRRQLEVAQSSSTASERLLQRTVVTAQRTADQTVEEARTEAERLLHSPLRRRS